MEIRHYVQLGIFAVTSLTGVGVVYGSVKTELAALHKMVLEHEQHLRDIDAIAVAGQQAFKDTTKSIDEMKKDFHDDLSELKKDVRELKRGKR